MSFYTIIIIYSIKMVNDIDIDNNIVSYYSSVKFYKKRIKELEIEIYKFETRN